MWGAQLAGGRSSRLRLVLALCLITVQLAVLTPTPRAYAAGLAVNSVGDAADANAGDGTCETATPGECTLRAAIEEANALGGLDTISFAIAGAGVHTIAPLTALPSLVGPVIVDGLTQPGASCAAWPPTLLVQLDGSAVPSSIALGFFSGGGSTVRGLVINRFGDGIVLANTSNNTIECNFLGTNAAGTLALGNATVGIQIQQVSNNNTIGGPAVSQRNLISGNGTEQIELANFSSAPTGNSIVNNYIGTDVSGTTSLGGGLFGGISIFGSNTTAVLNNLISGQTGGGISVLGDAARISAGTIIQGNRIGTDAAGTAVIANGAGVTLGTTGNEYVQNTLIGTNGDGASDAAERNLISGNTTAIVISGDLANNTAINNVIAGNYIGLDVTGAVALPNGNETIVINGATNTRIGTNADGVADAAERNVIIGGEAIWIISGSTGTVVAGNYIGTDAAGTVALNGTGFGVELSGAGANTRVGTNGDGVNDAAERNIISGNGTGVVVSLSTNSVVAGNYIGVGPDGTTAVPNATGIAVSDSNAVRIGTDNNDPAEANLIASNTGNGVEVTGASTFGVRIVGNRMRDNGGLGIDLGADGPTANDAGDADSGPNNLQNYPVLTGARISGGDLIVDYSIDSIDAFSNYPTQIHFYAVDSAASGEGALLLGSAVAPSDGSFSGINLGNAVALGVSAGDPIVATATDALDITSEFSPASQVGATTFSVTNTGDEPDLDTGDGVCAAATEGCTLRAAIQQANAVGGTSVINFDIAGAGVQTIAPLSALPIIAVPLTIDGLTQTGASCAAWPPALRVELDATNAGGFGLRVGSASLTMRGLVINRYANDGVFLDGASDGNRFECNFIGTTSDGTASLTSGNSAIFANGANNNVIGGPAISQRNLFSGNNSFEQLRMAGSDGNTIQGNYIGTNVSGTAAMAGFNSRPILITGSNNQIGGTAGTTPGGPCTGACNVIAGGNAFQIWISAPGITGNVVQGNHIGVNAAGTALIGSTPVGIQIDSGAVGTTVGGTTAAARNLIGGHYLAGIQVDGAATTGTTIQGNYIGTNAAGTASVPNGNGIVVTNGAPNTTIGGTAAGAGNLISGNRNSFVAGSNGDGIAVNGAGLNTTIQGNLIGTNPAGTAALRNDRGIWILNTDGALVGGTTAAARNLISGNGGFGVLIQDSASSNVVEGNYIGTNAAGSAAIANGLDGLKIQNAPGNTVGGGAAGSGNLISGNGRHGIFLQFGGANGTSIYGNRIGTDAAGAGDLGNGENGISLADTASNNVIGGIVVGQANTIAFNDGRGIVVTDDGVDNLIRGNSIFANTGIGIDLGGDGVTFNHEGGLAGPNSYQNYPVLTLATTSGTSVRVAGSIRSTPGQNFVVDIYANQTCNATSFGDGQIVLGSFIAGTADDGFGTFDQTIVANVTEPMGITAVASGPDGSSEFSYCRPVSTPNLNWAAAQPMVLAPVSAKSVGATAQQLIVDRYQEKWFKFPVQPGDTVHVTLAGQAGGAVTLHRDPTSFYNGLNNPPSAAVLSAAAADTAFLPSQSLPSQSLPSQSLPSGYLAESYAGAARRSLMAASFDPYATVQTIDRTIYDLQENLYVRVVGPYDLANPFSLQVTVDGGVCGEIQPVPDTLPAIAGGAPAAGSLRTLILTDGGRLHGSAAEVAAALEKMGTLASRADVGGAVIDLSATLAGGGPRYPRVDFANEQADRFLACPSAKNTVAREIKAVVDAYRAANAAGEATTLQYIVLAGGADVIPFFQVADLAGLASEKEYVVPVRPSSASEAGLSVGLVQSQDGYGASVELVRGDHTLAMPDLAVGRLVDTAGEIGAAIDAYIATGGVVAPASALVTGYDFVGDAADLIRDEMSAGLSTTAPARVDTLIQAPGLPPNDPSAWSAADLREQLLSGAHDIAVLTGHFSAGNLLAADYRTELAAAELDGAADLSDIIILALGCHGGYSVPGADLLAGSSPDPDWARAFLRRGAAGFVSATGYAYGDTELTEYGERLFVGLAQQLRTGSGPVSLGQALVAAKQRYLAETAQLSGIDEKTVVEMALYGLPMMRVDMPGARLNPTPEPSIVGATAEVTEGPGAVIGLRVGAPTGGGVSTATTPKTLTLPNLADGTSVDATYLIGADGVVANPFEPILPKDLFNVSVGGLALRGVALRGGTYSDQDGVIPLTTAPATETSRANQSFESESFYPGQLLLSNYYDAVGGGPTRLVTVPAQFKSRAPGAIDGTLRRYSSMRLALYYLPEDWPSQAGVREAAVAAAPTILAASATEESGVVTFRVNALGDGAAGVQEVWVLYTGASGPLYGEWLPLDLARPSPDLDPTLWQGALTLPANARAADLQFMVQAVSGAGLTSLATNLGAYYPVSSSAPLNTTPAATAVSLLSAPAAGAYLREASFEVSLTSDGAPLAGRQVLVSIGGQSARATTDAGGLATVTLRPIIAPGDYTLQATFRGEADYSASSARAPFVVQRDSTSVAVSPASATAQAGQPTPISATVRDSEGRALGGKSVVFVVSGGGQTIARSVTSDFWGGAALGALDLPAGSYTVDAYFSGDVPIGGGQTLALSDDYYLASRSLGASLTILGAGDTTAPTVTASASTADGQPYVAGTWARQAVTVRFACADEPGGSGIASCPADQTLTADGVTPLVSGTAADVAGNTASASFGPVKIDRAAPDTSVSGGPTAQTSATTASFTLGGVDPAGGSGLAGFECRLDAGPWASCSSPKAYSGLAIGAHTFQARAIDTAGNVDPTPASYSWTIKSLYTFDGFYWPVYNPPTVNRARAGVYIPVRFSLGGNFGLNIFAPGYPQSQQVACSPSTSGEIEVGETASGGNLLVYNPLTKRYIYLWKTEKSWAGTCRQLIVKFNDGSPARTANFRFVR